MPLDLPDVGGDLNSWGSVLNAALASLETSVAGKADSAATTAALAGKAGVADDETITGQWTFDTPPLGLPSSSGTDLDAGVYGYNVTGSSLRKWRAALARQESTSSGTITPAKVLCLGDSNTLGAGLNSSAATYPFLLRKLFETGHVSAGSGLIALTSSANFQANGVNAVDNRVNFVGTWAVDTRGPFNAGARSATGTGNSVVFTDTGDSLSVHYVKGPDCGSFSVSVDGGAPAVVDASGTAGLGVHTVTGLSAGTSHAMTVTAPATGKLVVYGFESKIGSTNGVRVSKVGESGATAASIVQDGSTAGSSSLAAIFGATTPDLTVLMVGTNEYLNTHVTKAAFKASVLAIITQAKVTGDVLLVVPIPQQDTDNTPAASVYTAALYELADEQDCALLDLEARWGSHAISSASPLSLYNVDGFHASNRGYWDIAKAVFGVIGELIDSPSVTRPSLTAPNTFTAAQTFSSTVAVTGVATFAAKPVFSSGISMPNGQTITMGETNISRDSGFVLSVGGFWKAQRMAANGASTSFGTLSSKAASGIKAYAAENASAVVMAGFGESARLFSKASDRQTTVGAAGAAAALPATPTTYWKIEDESGNVLVVPAYAAS